MDSIYIIMHYSKSILFFRHQDVTKCLPGQSLRISVDDATRYLSQVYETDFEVRIISLCYKPGVQFACSLVVAAAFNYV